MNSVRKLRAFRIASASLLPVYSFFRTLPVLAPFAVSSVMTFLALYAVQKQLRAWLPVSWVRIDAMFVLSALVGAVSSVPPFLERRTRRRLRSLISDEYLTYVIAILQEKMDRKIDGMTATYHPSGELTMSIMVPFGNEPLIRARQLKIVAASSRLRPLPSMNLTLDWGQGVAGKVWSQGVLADELAVKNTPEFLEEAGIRAIAPEKQQKGGFNHLSGICFPVTTANPNRRKGEFLGVLNIGSNLGDDYSTFSSQNFKSDVYTFIHESLKESMGLLRLKRIE